MSKKPRRRKTPLKALLPKQKVKPTETIQVKDEALGVLKPSEYEFVMSDESVLATEKDVPLNVQVETVLLTAPRLPWRFDTAYIDKPFRKAYVAMLRNLVELYNLPYLVNQEAILTKKE